MTNDAMKTFETAAAEGQKAMNENMEKAAKSFEDIAALNQDALDAMMRSQGVAAKAVEEMNAEIMAFSKKAVEEGVAHAKDIAGAQTVTEFMEKQTAYAKSAFEQMTQQGARVNDLATSAAKEIFAPMQSYFTAAADQMKTFRA